MKVKIMASLCFGVFISGVFAEDRMILVYGTAESSDAKLHEMVTAATTAEIALASGSRTIVIEGSRTLTAEHSLLPGERGYFVSYGGGFSFDGFKQHGGSVRFVVAGAEAELAKPSAESKTIMYASALQGVVMAEGRLRVDYTQASAGRVSVEVLTVNGKVLLKRSWVDLAGSHLRSLSLPAVQKQMLIVRWTDGSSLQVRKIVSR